MVPVNTEIRDFLRSARARVRPEDVGLGAPVSYSGFARRVPGLRREEVAQLAGVSVDYYARLEQGRTRSVSASVRRAVADALRLNATEQEYFEALLGASELPRRAPERRTQRVRPGIHRLLASFDESPAFVIGRGMQVLAMNPLARALLFDLDALPLEDRNLAKWTFLDPHARDVYVDWELVAADAAAILRVDTAADPDDRSLDELIGELTVKSADFRRMWDDHHVYECTHGSKRLQHPLAGRIDVDYEAFDVPGDPQQKMFVYSVAPGSRSAENLSVLASWTADGQPNLPASPAEPFARDGVRS